MTTEQTNEFLMDYGPVIWFVFLSVFFVAVLVKAWPFISSVVKTVEIITELPARFEHIYEKLDTLEIRLMSVRSEEHTSELQSLVST
jgi:hypothetical protein